MFFLGAAVTAGAAKPITSADIKNGLIVTPPRLRAPASP